MKMVELSQDRNQCDFRNDNLDSISNVLSRSWVAKTTLRGIVSHFKATENSSPSHITTVRRIICTDAGNLTEPVIPFPLAASNKADWYLRLCDVVDKGISRQDRLTQHWFVRPPTVYWGQLQWNRKSKFHISGRHQMGGQCSTHYAQRSKYNMWAGKPKRRDSVDQS